MAIGMRVGISLSSMQRLNCHQLTWSDKLAADAKNWAEEMKATAGFSHSPSSAAGKGEYGEAIAGIFNETTAGIIQGQHDWSKEKDKPIAGLSRRTFLPVVTRPRVRWCSRSLHTDGVANHDRGRLRDFSRWGVDAFRGSGVPL